MLLLEPSSQSQHQVKSGFLLNVVVAQGAAILQLLSSEDQSLLVRWDSFLVLDLGLHVFDGVRRLHIQGDGLSSQGTSSQRSAFLLLV